MNLPESLREELKIPLGVLLPDQEANKENIQKFLTPDSYIISVGDRTTEKLIDFGLVPSLQIIDNLEKRAKRESPKLQENTTELFVDNPPAKITLQSIDLIKNAFLSTSPVRIIVNGEEDLLVIPVCIYAPQNAVVFYGQPNEGLVIVKVTAEIRNKTQNLLDSMN